MQEMTGFGFENRLSLHPLEWKLINDERDIGQGDERIFSYTDNSIRHFVRQSNKSGKVGALKQVFDSPIAQLFSGRKPNRVSNYAQIKKLIFYIIIRTM